MSARVFVNDVWTKLFGTSLVQIKSDFGTRSKPPIQLHLLDHLAEKIIDFNWSRKKLIEYIVNSNTYKQSSERTEEADKKDLQNNLTNEISLFSNLTWRKQSKKLLLS